MPRNSPSPLSVDDLMHLIAVQLKAKKVKPSWDSQEATYDAMDAQTAQQQRDLLLEALRLDGGNIDALTMILNHVSMNAEQRLTLLRQIVKLGEHRLGKKFFKECSGEFWLHLDARPYMRVRACLASDLYDSGDIEAAIAEWEAMMTLNASDNQGLRYGLLCAYMEQGRFDDAARLFACNGEPEYNTAFAWCMVLDCLLRGDASGAEKRLKTARKQNPHTEPYLTGRVALPTQMPDGYSPGDESESVVFAEMLERAWSAHPNALAWLMAKEVSPPSAKAKRGTKRKPNRS